MGNGVALVAFPPPGPITAYLLVQSLKVVAWQEVFLHEETIPTEGGLVLSADREGQGKSAELGHGSGQQHPARMQPQTVQEAAANDGVVSEGLGAAEDRRQIERCSQLPQPAATAGGTCGGRHRLLQERECVRL